MNNIIDRAIEYVKDFFEKDFSGHDFYHTLRVYNLAKFIAEKENGDKEIIELAALLHDVDDYKLVGEQEEKFKNAKKFLIENNYPNERIENICHIISEVSFKGKDTKTPDTLEGKVVQDADRLDAMGAIGISRTFAYGGNKNRPMHIPNQKHMDDDVSAKEYYENEGTSINHFYEKLLKLKDLMNTKTAQEIAIHRHKYMEDFLKEFYNEWDGVV